MIENGCQLNPDIDNDGVIDGIEAGLDLSNLKDSDGDGIADMFDPDDEGDGQPSAGENRIVGCDPDPVRAEFEARYCYVIPEGGTTPDNVPCVNPPVDEVDQYWRFRCKNSDNEFIWFDFGGNSLEDYPNTDEATGGPLPRNPDTVPDFLDPDDDGDGIPTLEEGMGDLDGDGIPNAYDPYDHDGPQGDPDGDGLITEAEVSIGTDPYDDDSDNDAISDGVEVGDVNAPVDSDGDTLIDALDPDDDDDTIGTLVEGTADIDGDDLPNHLDTDSDGDGVPDRDEGADEDADCDGLWNAYDPDDNDGPCMDEGPGTADGSIYTKSGCGCATPSPAGSGAAFVLLLGGLIARRRR